MNVFIGNTSNLGMCPEGVSETEAVMLEMIALCSLPAMLSGILFYSYLIGLANIREQVPGKGKRILFFFLAPWLFLVLSAILGARTRLEHLPLLILLIFLPAKETRARALWSLLFAAFTFFLQYLLIIRLTK